MNSNPGRPVKTVEFVRSKTKSKNMEIVLYEEGLKSILNKAGDRDISIVSFAGPSHEGKSFLLSFMLDHMEKREESEIILTIPKSNPLLNEYKWDTCGDLHPTSGLFMWSEPLIIKSKNSEIETAILLMNVQERHNISLMERVRLIGFSSLISSRMFGNIIPAIPKSEKELLKLFSSMKQYQLKVNSDTEALANSENLNLQLNCIEDSNWLEDNQLNASVSKLVSAFYKKCSKNQEIDISVIPVTSKDGQSQKEKLYSECLSLPKMPRENRKLIFDSPRMKLLGEDLTAEDIFNCFNSYVNLFNQNEEVSFVNIIKTSVEVVLQNLIRRSLAFYDAEMNVHLNCRDCLSDLDLTNFSQKSTVAAEKFFNQKAESKNYKAYLNEMEVEKVSADLNYQLFLKCKKSRATNEMKRIQWFEVLRQRFVQNFKVKQAKLFENTETYLEDKSLIGNLEPQLPPLIELYRSKISQFVDREDVTREADILKNLLVEEMALMFQENHRRKEKAEKKNLELLNKNVLKLVNKIGSQRALEFVTQKLLDTSNEQGKEASSLQSFCCLICYEENIGVVFQCGHAVGKKCHGNLKKTAEEERGIGSPIRCPQCREVVTSTISLFI